MSYGFTGTRNGPTEFQMLAFINLICEQFEDDEEFHHGDCVGADEEMHETMKLWLPDAKIIIHPPEDPTYRAFCKPYHFIHDPKPFLDRNKHIVDSSKKLIACPEGFEEKMRSGTWSTIRYARKRNIPRSIIWPDGKIKEEA